LIELADLTEFNRITVMKLATYIYQTTGHCCIKVFKVMGQRSRSRSRAATAILNCCRFVSVALC